MKVKGQMRKYLSVLLCLCMMFTSVGAAFVPTAEVSAEACEHHPEHTEECGYAAAVAGVDCAHEHDESCGFVEAKGEVPCDKGCQEVDESKQIVHVEGCSYSPAVEEHCSHEHDEVCGYAAAVEGKPCQFVCEICGAKDTVDTVAGEVPLAAVNDYYPDGFSSDQNDCRITSVNITFDAENLYLIFTFEDLSSYGWWTSFTFQVAQEILGLSAVDEYRVSTGDDKPYLLTPDKWDPIPNTKVEKISGSENTSRKATLPLSLIEKTTFSLKFGNTTVSYEDLLAIMGKTNEEWLAGNTDPALQEGYVRTLRGGAKTDTTPTILLAGSNNDLRADTLTRTIQNYRDNFLMGVAADFCVFLQKDFTVTESDAEGRVAVGGNITNKTSWNYVIGAGDYENKTPLDSLLKDRLGAATIILGGEVKNNALGDVHYNSESTRKLVINQNLPISGDYSLAKIPGVNSGQVDQTQTYVTKLFDFEDSFTYLKTASQEIADLAKLSTSVRDHKNKIEYDPGTRTITFTYGGKSTDIRESVYFNLSGDAVENFSNARFVKYENIPLFSTEGREVVTNTGGSTTWYYSYIIVNVEGTGTIRLSPADTSQGIDGTKFTTISGSKGEINISNVNGSNNNEPGVTSLLYNFSEASMVVLGAGNFQGTVFAPGAPVKDEASLQGDDVTSPRGHLSGALIAQSFIGATEFGYRPFSGPFGVISGSLEVSKTVLIDGSSPVGGGDTFTFTVTINNYNLKDGDYGDVEFKDNTATFTLKDGESVLITDLPVGVQYTVTETDNNGYEVSINGVIKADASITDTIPVGKKAEAKFTNTKTTSTTDGNLQVSKTASKNGQPVTGPDAEIEFEFRITITNGTVPDKVYGDIEFKNNQAEFTLKPNEIKTATGLPAGVTYTVEETNRKGYTSSSTGSTNGTITAGKTDSVAFVNTLTTSTVDETGSLTVTKTVKINDQALADGAPEKDKAFTFTVTITSEGFKDGEYGGTKFENKKTTFTLKDGESKTITGLPAGVTYTIEETDNDGYTVTYEGKTGTILAGGTNTANITNAKTVQAEEYPTGSLTVSKTVTNGGDTNKEFTFTVTLTGSYKDSDGEKDASKLSGTFSEVTFTNGKGTFKLKHSQSKTISGLPVGVAYTVEETDNTGYTVTYKGNTGTISATTQASVDVTNALITQELDPGNLEVSKKVVDGNGKELTDDQTFFTFTVTLKGSYYEDGKKKDASEFDKILDSVTFTKGTATFTLKNGQTKKITGLPAGLAYTVTETKQNGYTSSSTGASGTITAKGTATAAFTNTYDDPGEPGSLVVSKSVRGSEGDTTKEFTFTVKLGNTSINGTYGGMTFTNGVATFKLKHGQSKTATGLPVGTTYTVTETDNDGYTVNSTGATGTISATGAVKAAFINSKGRVPQTGDEANAGLWLALGGVALAGIIASSVFVLKKKKRSN